MSQYYKYGREGHFARECMQPQQSGHEYVQAMHMVVPETVKEEDEEDLGETQAKEVEAQEEPDEREGSTDEEEYDLVTFGEEEKTSTNATTTMTVAVSLCMQLQSSRAQRSMVNQ